MKSAQITAELIAFEKSFVFILYIFFTFIFETCTKRSVQGLQTVLQELSQFTELHNDEELKVM